MTITEAKSASLTRELRLTGTLTAERSARLSPRIDGLVARLHVDAGDRVKAGDALLDLDTALATHALRRAQGSVAEARATRDEAQRLLDEARRLIEGQHLPQTELARREANLQLAEAALVAQTAVENEQREVIRRHVLPAPFAGVIARRLTDIGEWVTRGTPVVELVSLDRIRLDVQAPQEHFRFIETKSRVEVRADSLPGTTFPARIDARVPVSDANARTFLVRIVLEKPPTELLPGTSATAVIHLGGGTEAVVVPRDALMRYPDGTFSVFLVRSAQNRHTVHEQRVSIGRGDGEVEILKGLSAGDRVVTRGNETLRDGQSVEVRAGG